jgi:hypothetical protein
MTKRKLIQRRKHKGIHIKSRAFVGIGPHFNKVGPLIDISMSGLKFLDIFLTDRDFYLSYVPFKAVSDSKTPDSPSGSVTTRQCIVQFGDLTPHQMSQLQYLIQNHTIGELN